MIFTSTCDPALFDSDALADPNYTGLLTMVLRSMTQNHLSIVDDTETLSKIMQKKLKDSPAFQSYYGALLQPERVVRVPVDKTRVVQLNEWIEASSAVAVACSEHSLVDCLIANVDTLTAMDEEKLDCSKATGIQNFSSCPWCSFDGAKKIGGMTKKQFILEIIRPAVRCAKKVTIIDKQIIKAAFGDGSQARSVPSTNWPSFKQTILAIYNEWMRGMYKGNGLFEVITWPVHHVEKKNRLLLGDDLAAALRKQLKFLYPNVRVMLKREQDFKDDMHDRYLVTDKGFMLGFTKGFDLSSGEKMGTCVVYLMKPDNLISRIMSPTNNCGISTSKPAAQ